MKSTALTSVGIKLRFVQVAQNLLDGLDSTIPSNLLVPPACSCDTHCSGRNIHLEIASDKELATHLGGTDRVLALKRL